MIPLFTFSSGPADASQPQHLPYGGMGLLCWDRRRQRGWRCDSPSQSPGITSNAHTSSSIVSGFALPAVFPFPLSPTTPLSFLNMRSPILAFSLFAVAATVSASPMPQLQQEESPILHSSVPTSQEASRLTPRWEDASRARTPGSFGNQDVSSMGTPQIAGVLPSSGELLGPSFFSLRRPNGV